MILHLLPVNASHYTKADLALHYIINLKNLVKSLLNKNIAQSPIRAALQTPSHILCIMKLPKPQMTPVFKCNRTAYKIFKIFLDTQM